VRNGRPLAGRVAVVTGGAGLLGRQHAAALASAGASVVVGDVDADGARSVAEAVAREEEAETLGLLLDVVEPDSLMAARETILSRWGHLDVLVNNAAIDDRFDEKASESSRFENYPLDLWRRMLDVNVTGVFLPSQVLGSTMATRRGGSIINIASTYGLVGPDPALYRRPDGSSAFHKSPAYPASKGAVLALTRFLAAYWGGAGVRVNALCPGGVRNGQADWFVRAYGERTPLGRMATPDDYRGAVVFLASDASRYMTGASLVVDGGFTAW